MDDRGHSFSPVFPYLTFQQSFTPLIQYSVDHPVDYMNTPVNEPIFAKVEKKFAIIPPEYFPPLRNGSPESERLCFFEAFFKKNSLLFRLSAESASAIISKTFGDI